MATYLRRTLAPIFVLVIFAVLSGSAQQQPPAGQAAGAVPASTITAPPQAVPRPAPAEQQALTAAMALKDPEAKLAALEKMRTDFPLFTAVDSQILATLVTNWPERLDSITAVFDRMIGRIPSDATADVRLNSTLLPVNQVVAKKLLLDRSEKLVTDAMGALDPEKYAQVQRDTASRASRPEPAQAQIETSFNALRARGLETRARIYAGKGDSVRAEATYKQAVAANPAFGTPAVTALVDLYTAKNDFASAEAILKDSIKASPTPAAAGRPSMALADLYVKKGDLTSAEALLRDVLKTSPTLTTATLALARVEEKRGAKAAALEHYLEAALGGGMTAADDVAMRALYRGAHNGSEAGLEETLDTAYNEKFPNPVKPEKYIAPADRSDRVVLLEMFTGSGCGPCVSADLALDAALERYPANAIAVIAYHENIPAPDPMVVSGGEGRKEYYSLRGVPTFNIDGALGRLGGGARTNTAMTYADYVNKIDKALTRPAQAGVSVAATGEGDQIAVTATVSKLPRDAKDLRLHILLVERELKFTGENGIRFHPMVVRAMAGEKGAGIPITGNGTSKHVFSLTAIKDEVTRTLATEMTKRRGTETPGSAPRDYSADGRAYTAIDTSELMVVAFVQQGAYTAPAASAPAPGVVTDGAAAGAAAAPPAAAAQTAAALARPASNAAATVNVLQAAKADVVFATSSKGKGGDR